MALALRWRQIRACIVTQDVERSRTYMKIWEYPFTVQGVHQIKRPSRSKNHVPLYFDMRHSKIMALWQTWQSFYCQNIIIASCEIWIPLPFMERKSCKTQRNRPLLCTSLGGDANLQMLPVRPWRNKTNYPHSVFELSKILFGNLSHKFKPNGSIS